MRKFRAVVRERARAAWIETDSDPNRCPSSRPGLSGAVRRECSCQSPCHRVVYLSSSMGSRETGKIVGSITLDTIMGCNDDIDESRDVGVDACDGNIKATIRKGDHHQRDGEASTGEKSPVQEVHHGGRCIFRQYSLLDAFLSRWGGRTRE